MARRSAPARARKQDRREKPVAVPGDLGGWVRDVRGLTCSDLCTNNVVDGAKLKARTHKRGHWPNVRLCGEPNTPGWRE